MTGVSPSGKATVFDTVIRWFESSYPNQIKNTVREGGFFMVQGEGMRGLIKK